MPLSRSEVAVAMYRPVHVAFYQGHHLSVGFSCHSLIQERLWTAEAFLRLCPAPLRLPENIYRAAGPGG